MKILNKLYNLFKEKKGPVKSKIITNFDNADFREEDFKRNILFTTIFLFLIFLFIMLYVFFKQNVIQSSEDEQNELPPLRIVIPYPNNSINIDDYEILKYQIKSGDSLLNILTKQ